MKGGILLQIAITFATVSLVAIGGANAVTPEIHRRVVDVLGWMNDGTFANLFAISQTAPGPNVLLVSLIGWHVAGFTGLIVATLAMMIPSSLLAFWVGRVANRQASSPWIAMVKAGLVPIAVGLVLASGAIMAKAAHQGLLTMAITTGTVVFVVTTDRNPLWALASGAGLSLIGFWLGIAG